MKFKRLALWLLALAVLLTMSTGNCSNKTPPDNSELYKQIQLFSDAVALIQANYVDEVEPQKLIYGSLSGMLKALDPYSQFMDPDTYNEMRVETTGQFGGLGIEISIKDNLLTIIAPIDGTPAYKAGLKSGDKIVKIDGEPTRDITLIEAVKKLRGKPGTNVELTILREEEMKILDISITRDIIKITSIKEAKLIDGSIGYIKLVEFQEGTENELESSLKNLEGGGMTALILDLRNNPGGLLNTAAEVSDKFLAEGKLIVTTRGRRKNQIMEFKARQKKIERAYPLVIMVNGGSASASEIVAGAIQDNKRGLCVGTKSFGKGSVQTVIPLADGSALRLTTAKYFTPSGKSIVNNGIAPDVIVEQKELKIAKETSNDSIFQQLDEEGLNKTIKEEEQETERYDQQLVSAINILKGIIAYKNIGSE